jgi:hypothetical protein
MRPLREPRHIRAEMMKAATMNTRVTVESAPVLDTPIRTSSPAEHGRAWWRAEAVRTGADCSGVVGTALEMLVAAGIVEQPQFETITPWDAPGGLK